MSESIIVVGAGMAGLAAAKALTAAGLDVTIIESRERIGGRTWTSDKLDVPLDLGASWIHGLNNNVFTELAKELGLTTHFTDFDDTSVYQPDGNEDEQYYGLEDDVEEAFYERAEKSDVNLSAAEAMAGLPESLGLTPTQWDFFLGTVIEADYAADVNELSVSGILEGEEPRGGHAMIDQGYIGIVNHLAAGLNIRLNCLVNKIRWSKDGVELEAGDEILKSDRVVLTVPLGVLKSDTIVFEPPLPENKQRAIDGLQMGLLNKIILRFPTVFWDEEETAFGRQGQERGKLVSWLNLYPMTGEPILVTFNAANAARHMEALSDDQTLEEAMALLRELFGSNIPAPTNSIITRWAQDPHSYGSYSYLGKDSSPDMRTDLAASIHERLYFAGEATNSVFPASAHGAYLSGLRAAEEILKLTGHQESGLVESSSNS